MRCGKELTNSTAERQTCRNPRECAVAKNRITEIAMAGIVATRANALWQRPQCPAQAPQLPVATRANALWQRVNELDSGAANVSQPARMRCGKEPYYGNCNGGYCRNPRECAVAKAAMPSTGTAIAGRNPRECAVAKLLAFYQLICRRRRNPRECAVAKSYAQGLP